MEEDARDIIVRRRFIPVEAMDVKDLADELNALSANFEGTNEFVLSVNFFDPCTAMVEIGRDEFVT